MPNRWIVSLCIALSAAAAHAEVKQSAADGFLVAHQVSVPVPPERAFAALAQIGKWWNPQHTWSGDAANLSLEPKAGTCYCERWNGGEAEHMRVVFVVDGKTLRLQGGLGPLQGMGLYGILEWNVAAAEPGSTIALTYRVSGDSLSDLTALVPAVDGVLGEQMGRLQRYLETGKPDEASNE